MTVPGQSRVSRSLYTVGILFLGFGALTACQKVPSGDATNQGVAVEGNLATGDLPANMVIETLPPDESSGTSLGELNNGEDNPDVADFGNNH